MLIFADRQKTKMEVLSRTDNNILIITINRESSLNALNKNVIHILSEIFNSIQKSPNGIKGVILTGAGSKSFVAGADITEFQNISQKEGEALSLRGQKLFSFIEALEIPVIAAINGFALGGGCELAMSCHLRVAGEHARFGQPELNLGLIPGYGATQRLSRYIGKTKTMELLLTGDMINANEALTLGLVNQVCESGLELTKSIELIEKISKKGPKSIAAIIRTVNAYYRQEGPGFEFEASEFGKMMESEEAKEGITAFIEKRKPIFRS